jgi:hypothetical protein
METRTRITHRKGWSEGIGGVVYSKAKSRLENEYISSGVKSRKVPWR